MGVLTTITDVLEVFDPKTGRWHGEIRIMEEPATPTKASRQHWTWTKGPAPEAGGDWYWDRLDNQTFLILDPDVAALTVWRLLQSTIPPDRPWFRRPADNNQIRIFMRTNNKVYGCIVRQTGTV